MKNIKENKFVDRIQKVPIAFTGIALGVGGLGNAWINLYPEISWLKYITIPIVILLVCLLLTKIILHPKTILKELKEPLLSSFFPTFCMCLMLISGFVASFDKTVNSASQIIASIIMVVAIVLQFGLIGIFLKFIIVKHSWHEHPMYGSWFVPTVGLITSCTVATKFTALPALFFQIIWFIGFGLYVITFLPITYSLLFKTKPDINKFPSIAVFFAPANLTPSGFMNSFWFNHKQIVNSHLVYNYGTQMNLSFVFIFIFIGVAFGLAMSFILYIFLIRIFKIKFSFVFASVSFPLAISSTTMILFFKFSRDYMCKNFNSTLTQTLTTTSFCIGNIFVILSTIIILFVFTRMIINLFTKIFFEKNQDK